MPNNAISKLNKELEDKYKEMDLLLKTDTKTERDYITKHPSQRDQYDVAFGKLNPESRAKADRFGNLVNEIQTINNNIVNLESAKNFFNDLYSQQRSEVNSGFDKLQHSNALSNDIALSSALATAGGMGASGIQSAGLKAQGNNILFTNQLKAESDRQNELSKITQAEAQVPLQLANIGQINANLSAQSAPGRSYGGGGGRPSYTKGRPSNQTTTADDIANKYGIKKNPDGTYDVGGYSISGDEFVRLASLPDFEKNLELVKSKEQAQGGKFLMKGNDGTFKEVELSPEQLKELQAKGMKVDNSQFGDVEGKFSFSDAFSRGLLGATASATASKLISKIPNPWVKGAAYLIPAIGGFVSEAVSPGTEKVKIDYPIIGDGSKELRNEAAVYYKRKRKT